MNAPKYVRRAIAAASAPYGSDRLRIRCERTQEWMTRALGLVTDDNAHDLLGESVNFDWTAQRWYVAL